MNTEKPGRKLDLEMMAALGVTLVLVALHIILLTSAGPLWRDEISSLGLATKPTLSSVWETMVYDPFPLQFFMILRGWSALVGNSDFTLRLLGFAIGLSCIAAFWISARLTGRRTPILALALLGMSPTLVIWGDTLRPYGLGVFWIVITFGCFWRVLQQPSRSAAISAAVAAILSVQALFTNSLIIFALGVAASVVAAKHRNWSQVGLILGICLFAAVSLLPYAGIMQASQEWASMRKIHVGIDFFLTAFKSSLLTGGPAFWWAWLVIVVATAVVTLWGKRSIFARAGNLGDASLYGLIAGILGFIATMIFFRVVSWPTNVWYYLPCLALIAMCVDLVLDFGSLGKKGPLLRSLTAIGVAAIISPAIFAQTQTRASNLDVVARAVEKAAGPEDLIVLYPFTDGITFHRYFRGTTKYTTVPNIEDLTLHRWNQVVEQTRTTDAVAPIVQQIDATLKAGHQVWLVTSSQLIIMPEPAPVVPPSHLGDNRSFGNFFVGWELTVYHELTVHAISRAAAELRIEQPVSPYEQSQVWRFSGWKAAAEQPATVK